MATQNGNDKNKGIAKPQQRDNQNKNQRTEIAVNKIRIDECVKNNITTTSTGPRNPIKSEKSQS